MLTDYPGSHPCICGCWDCDGTDCQETHAPGCECSTCEPDTYEEGE